MRTRLPGAVVLVGWLLMFAPQAERSGVTLAGPDVSAPLGHWQAMGGDDQGESGAFATKQDCEDYRAKAIPDAKGKLLDAPPGVENLPSKTHTVNWTFALSVLHSQCISADDPRLRLK